ncbi:MAG TPA: hemerythrin domain-containing protein [Thermoplasmata archaeon]|nr:hemerythrin domain-containing protein [Thermoplasmata archaeon]
MRSMVYELGLRLQTTDFTDASQSKAIATQLKHDLGNAISDCILCLLRAHSGHEEKYFFSAVQPFDPDVVELMMREHGEVVRRILRVSSTCDELIGVEKPDRRIELGDRLNMEANDLFAFYLDHLNNEESAMVPIMWERFTDEQLREIRSKFYDGLPLNRFEDWMRWTLPALNENELIVFFGGMKKEPGPRFGDLVRLAKETLGAERWQVVQQRAGLGSA